MKKLLIAVLATSSAVAFADSFQDFNNNLYTSYALIAPTYTNAQNINQWGIGGTFQSKNDVWVNANASMGQSNAAAGQSSGNNFGNIGFKAGYAFQFFNNEDNGFQVIPYVSFSDIQGTAQGSNSNNITLNNGQVYNYGVGVQPEYRLLGSLKVALGLGLTGNQINVGGQDQQNFNYYVNPQVQYDIAKTVMLSAGYTYQNAFNSGSAFTGVGGTNVVDVKVGYLF